MCLVMGHSIFFVSSGREYLKAEKEPFLTIMYESNLHLDGLYCRFDFLMYLPLGCMHCTPKCEHVADNMDHFNLEELFK